MRLSPEFTLADSQPFALYELAFLKCRLELGYDTAPSEFLPPLVLQPIVNVAIVLLPHWYISTKAVPGGQSACGY
jgi:hypothetical protein